MKIENMEEFAALALTLNYSKVAKRFHITPSVLSKHIAALEREVGQQLFIRSTTSVELTAAGRRFYEGISPVLEEYRTFMDGFCVGCTSRSRQLNISLGVRTSHTLRAAALAARRMEEDHSIRVNFIRHTSGSQFNEEALGEADALITYATEKVTRESIIIPLERDPFVGVMPKDHPLAVKKSISLVEDMSRYRTIRLKDTYFEPGQDAIQEAFSQFGVQPDYVYSLASSFDDISLFFNFKEVLILPSEAISLIQAISPDTHVVLPFQEDVFFQLSLVHLPKKSSESLTLFADEMKSALRDTA